MNRISIGLVLLTGLLALGACRGGTSTKPPVHLVLDMDFQPKLKAQAETRFAGWSDNRAMRLPVAGTVARGPRTPEALMPDANNPGKNADGSWIAQNPLALSLEVLERGRERYDIHCAICHGKSGRGGNGNGGHGLVGRRWPVVIPNFHRVEGKDNRVADFTDGQFFEVMSSPVGRNTMPSYAARVNVHDRWAIVHYIRALQNLGKQ
ncbi:MAG: cytochrome c [Planctomycetota bacterium]